MNSNDLTSKTYWEKWYQSNREPLRPVAPKSPIKKIFEGRLEPILNFSEWFLWKVLYPQFLEVNSSLKVVEVGCAPGNHLLRFHQEFGYQPYGIEYTAAGAETNRRVFSQRLIPAEQIYEEDFFSDSLQEKLRETFDVVVSNGFIEHFQDPTEAIKRHLGILKPGGILIIRIPNLAGKINQSLCRFFNVENLAIHNLSIMKLEHFRQLFPDSLEPLCCRYLGVFSFNLFNATSPVKQALLQLANLLQLGLNLVFALLARKGWPENSESSPYLIYIGRKKA